MEAENAAPKAAEKKAAAAPDVYKSPTDNFLSPCTKALMGKRKKK